jgi:MFS family permease
MYLGNMSVPILAQEREWERELGWMSSLYLIGMVFGRVLGGWLLNRVNNLYALHTCICLLVITTLLYGIVSLPALFMGLRVIQGMVQGVTFSLNDILITRILMSVPPGETEVPKQQFAKGMGYYSVAGTLSIFVVGYSGLFLMGKLHFSLMYMVMAIITAVLYIWVSRFITKKKAFVLPQGDKPKWWNFFVFAAIPYGMTLSIVLSRVFVGHLSSRPERSMVFAISVITLGSLLIWKGQGFLAYGAVLVIGLGFGIAIILFFDMLKRQMNPEMIGAAFATFSIVCFDLMPAFAKWLYGNEAVHQGYENSLGMLIGFPLSSLILFFLYLGIRKNRS